MERATRGSDVPAKQPRSQKPGHRLGKALLGIPLLAAAGWFGRKARAIPHDMDLPQPVPGERFDVDSPVGRLAIYVAGQSAPSDAVPLLLIHSINAAASAFEVAPIYWRSLTGRVVYAFDLPGYGHSERTQRLYTPRVMTDAILFVAEIIRSRHGKGQIDSLALSLSSEFLARAATEEPDLFRSIALISPTGFDRRGPRNGPPGSNRGMPALYKSFTVGLWRRSFFDLLTSRVSIRYFLEKTFGSKTIDEGLLDYDYRTTHQPGAEHAPYSFISGYLFSGDISRIYAALQLPVFMVHGTRGDFQDYTGKTLVEGRANWTIDVMQTGALPQFEIPDDFQARFNAFLTGVSAEVAVDEATARRPAPSHQG